MSQAEEDEGVLLAAAQRLLHAAPDMNDRLSPMATSMRQRQDAIRIRSTDPIVNILPMEHGNVLHDNKPYQKIIYHLRTIDMRLNAARSTVGPTTDTMTTQQNVPISVLTIREWLCLVRTCVSRFLMTRVFC